MSKVHELKTVQPNYDMVNSGIKRFEFRKNDRNYQAGDILILKEWSEDIEQFMTNDIGSHLAVRVLSILKDFPGIEPDYCIMSISDPI